MEKGKFKCAICHGVFEKDWTDEEAMEEFKQNFGEKAASEETDSVCNDCYKKVQKSGMFLEDKLLKLGRETELDTGSIVKCLKAMFNMCMNDARDSIIDKTDLEERKKVLFIIFKTWESVSDTLRAENRTFVARDGLRVIMQQRIQGTINPQSN